jgi:subfamily B ATP-binding cassette protein MsbA
MKSLKRLATYLLPYWKTLILVLICTAFVNGLALIQPLLIRDLLNKVLLQKNLLYLQFIVVAVLVIVALKGLFFYAQGYLMNWIGFSCVKKIREEMFVKLQHLPLGFFESWKTGEIFSRLTNDSGILTDVMSTSVVYLVNDAVILFGSLGWMIWKSPALTLLALVVSPLVAWVVVRFGKWMNHVTLATQARIAELSHVLFEGVLGIQTVKSCGAENHEIEKFKNKNEEYFGWNMKAIQVAFTQTPVVEFLAVLGIAIMVYFGGYEVVQGKFTIGDMFAFWGYMILATNPLYRLSSTLTNLQKASAAASRIFEIMDSKEEEEVMANLVVPKRVEGKLEFSHVWFRYQNHGEWVLKDVTFSVDPGTVVAIVGPNGAGKTSLVGLIPRFYTPTRGCVLLDGVDIRRIPLSWLRAQIAVVPQEAMLFSGTILENIRYGTFSATKEAVMEAAKAANAHDFIMQFPRGYDTWVGERGVSLSAGQKQRISIARAILRNPKILILDEATSNLDAESEKLVQEALERLMEGRTTFVIAHRFFTIRHAHKILALENGAIVEAGSHTELLARCGLYSRLYHASFQAHPLAVSGALEDAP